MKKILIGMLVMFLIITTLSSAVLGYLFIMKNNEVVALLNKAPAVPPSPAPDPSPTPTTATTLTFEDIGQGIKVIYPISWNYTLETKISADFAYDPEYGKVISKYILDFKKGDVELKLQQILAGIDGFPNPINKTTHDYVLVTPKLVRYSEKGKNQWTYSAKQTCEGLDGLLTPEQVAAADFCVGPFFSGFSKDNASSVTATGSNTETLKEVDQIVLSTASADVK